MKINLELLNHFSCSRCKCWWSIASVKFELGQKVYCPKCSYENTITEIDEGGNLEYVAMGGEG